MIIQILNSEEENILTQTEPTIVDLSKIERISSKLIVKLVAHKDNIVLCNVPPITYETLKLCSLDKILDIAKTLDDAKAMVQNTTQMRKKIQNLNSKNQVVLTKVTEMVSKIKKIIV